MVRRRAVAPEQRHPAIVKAEYKEMLEAAHANGWAKELNCYGREDEFADREDVPDAHWSNITCDGCPLADLCREFAEATRPAWGQYGGKFFVYGRSAHWAGNLAGKNDMDDDGFFDPSHEWSVDWKQRERELRTMPDEDE